MPPISRAARLRPQRLAILQRHLHLHPPALALARLIVAPVAQLPVAVAAPAPAIEESQRSVRKYLITGLLVWMPLIITIWVFAQVLGVVDNLFDSVLSASKTVLPTSVELDKSIEKLAKMPGLGLAVVLVVLGLTGMFVTNMFGQWWLKQWDRMMSNIPIVRSIYNSVKQVSDTLFSSNGNAFREAVLVQYPREGSWTIGFVTGKPSMEVAAHLPGEHVSVYVPTTPNPTSGFFLMMPRSSVLTLQMSVDEALKYIISMGVVAPPPPAPPAPAANTRNLAG